MLPFLVIERRIVFGREVERLRGYGAGRRQQPCAKRESVHFLHGLAAPGPVGNVTEIVGDHNARLGRRLAPRPRCNPPPDPWSSGKIDVR
jgi:hypothetical protein